MRVLGMDEFERRLQELAQVYRLSLADKRQRLRDLRAAVLGGVSAGQETQALASWRVATHQLAGSAPTYGYEALGQSARSLDGLLKPLAQSARRLGAADRQQLSQLADDLDEAFEQSLQAEIHAVSVDSL